MNQPITRPAAEDSLREQCTKLVKELDTLGHDHLMLEAEAARLRAQVAQETHVARLLTRCAELMNSQQELAVILRTVLDLAVEFTQAERGFIALTRPSQPLHVSVLHNLDGAGYAAERRVSQSIIDRVLQSGEPIVTTDAQLDPRLNVSESIIAQQIRSIICIPLKTKADIIGVVYLDSRLMPGLFSRREPEALFAFAHLAGPAIENARLFAQERARLSEISALEAFRTRILETVAGGVITIGHGTISSFNQAAERTFGVDARNFIHRPIHALDQYIPELATLLDTRDADTTSTMYVGGFTHEHDTLSLELRIAPVDTQNTVIVVNDLTNERALEKSFSRYLAPHVVQSLLHEPQSIQLGGERQLATILFADVRGFTAMSAQMLPEEVVEMLNRYLEKAVADIFARDGLLDKFHGDGFMAVFGPPRVRDDDAHRAVESAFALQASVDSLSATMRHPFRISIGLATGTVVAGHIGSIQRMDYTVIGDAVNLASRLQAKAPPGGIFCDEATYLAAGSPCNALPFQATIRGRTEALTLYGLRK